MRQKESCSRRGARYPNEIDSDSALAQNDDVLVNAKRCGITSIMCWTNNRRHYENTGQAQHQRK